MLLELIEHHPGLFLTTIEPLTMRRDCRSLAALAISCRRLRDFLVAEVPLYGHYLRWLKIRRTEDIKKIMYADKKYRYIHSVMFVNGKLTTYIYSIMIPDDQDMYMDYYDLEVQSENTMLDGVYDILVYYTDKNNIIGRISNPPKWLLRNKKLRCRFILDQNSGYKVVYKSVLRKN
jgi:hypothetical protein